MFARIEKLAAVSPLFFTDAGVELVSRQFHLGAIIVCVLFESMLLSVAVTCTWWRGNWRVMVTGPIRSPVTARMHQFLF
jgi:hypothetical protein